MTDISRKRGDTYADEFTIKSKKTKAAINLTGYSFVMVVDPNVGPTSSATNLFQIAGEIVDAATGRVAFAPTEPQADHIGIYYYEVQMIDATNKKRTVASGKYTFTQDIAK